MVKAGSGRWVVSSHSFDLGPLDTALVTALYFAAVVRDADCPAWFGLAGAQGRAAAAAAATAITTGAGGATIGPASAGKTALSSWKSASKGSV